MQRASAFDWLLEHPCPPASLHIALPVHCETTHDCKGRHDMTKLRDKVNNIFFEGGYLPLPVFMINYPTIIEKCYSMITFKTDLIPLTDYLAFYDRHVSCYFSLKQNIGKRLL